MTHGLGRHVLEIIVSCIRGKTAVHRNIRVHLKYNIYLHYRLKTILLTWAQLFDLYPRLYLFAQEKQTWLAHSVCVYMGLCLWLFQRPFIDQFSTISAHLFVVCNYVHATFYTLARSVMAMV